MSISKFQEKFLSQKGCAVVIAVGTCFVMSLFLFQSCARYGGAENQPTGGPSNQTIATIDDVPVTAQAVTSAMDRTIQQQAMMSRTPPQMTFQMTSMLASYALNEALSGAAMQVVAQQNHVDLSDTALLQAAKKVLDDNAPAGQKPDPKRDADSLARLKDALADPQKKASITTDLVPQILEQAIGATISATPDQVKHSYDTYSLKRIFFSTRPGSDPKAKSQEAVKALKGGMSFEAAMDKFSTDPPPGAGKKISDSKIDIPESQLSTVPSYKGLEGKPIGFVSDPVDDAGGTSIYKIVSVKNNAPKDLTTNAAKYKKDYIDQLARAKIQEQQKAVLDSKSIKWTDSAYQALYDLSKLAEAPSPAGHDEALAKIVAQAKAALKKPEDKIPALNAWFAAESQQYNAPGVDKVKLRPERIELLKTVLDADEDYALRMELIDLYVQQKDGTNALDNLVRLSEANTIYDATGQDHFRDIGAKGATLVADKLVTADQLKPLNDAQEGWKKGKEDSDKMAEETKKQEAEQKKLDAENKKANDALVAKEKAETSKTKTPPAPGVKVTPGATPPAKTPPAPGQRASQ